MWLFNNRERLLDYAEREGKINAEFHIRCTNDLFRSASSLLLVLLSGAGGGIALFMSLHHQQVDTALLYALVAASVYLFLVCGVLSNRCLMAKDIYPPANEPGNILHDKVTRLGVHRIREFNLEHLQSGITFNIKRNERTGEWLNKMQIASCLTPLVFFVTWILSS